MEAISCGRTLLGGAAHLRLPAVRGGLPGRAALLIGTAFGLHAAPGHAANECGPPPPGGGTVTCPAGNYPGGIDYAVPDDLEILLQPGVTTSSQSTIATGGDLRIVGPGLLSASVGDQALSVNSGGSAYIDLGSTRGTGFNPGAAIRGNGAVTFIAGSAFATGSAALSVSAGAAAGVAPNVLVRVGSASTSAVMGTNPGRVVTLSSQGGTMRVEIGTLAASGILNGPLSASGADILSLDIGRVFISGLTAPGMGLSGGSIAVTIGSIERGFAGSAISASAVHDIAIDIGTITGGEYAFFQPVGSDRPDLVALASGDGPIAVDIDTIAANRQRAIVARSDSGDIRISSNSITTTIGSAGAIAAGTGGTVRIDSNSISTRGDNSPGIVASGARVTVNSGTIAVQGTVSGPARSSDAIVAIGADGVSIVSGSITNNGSMGIRATSTDGRIDIMSGSVSVVGLGPLAQTTYAIHARSTGGGEVSVTSGTVASSFFRTGGIAAESTGGAVRVDAGTVTTDGTEATGISATSGSGAVTVLATNVATSGTGADAIFVSGGSGSAVTIRGLVQSAQGFAVQADGAQAALTVAAGGTLRGRIDLTGGADSVVNRGLFDALGTSQFGAGVDSFDNQAGATLRSTGGVATLAALETFTNGGLVELRDGAANDSLVLPGGYVGAAGARLGLDVDFASRTADRLVTGAATGSTAIELQTQGSGAGFDSAGILLVDAGAGTTASAFTLAGAGATPYLRTALRFDAAANDFLLVRLPGAAVFETARLGGMATALWQEGADAVAAQLDTARDRRRDELRGRRLGLWLQGWTGEREQAGTQSFAGAGGGAGETFDTRFDQDLEGLQGGIDVRAGGVLIGATGGIARSDAAFAATGDPVALEAKSLGAYVQGRAGRFFFNALAKRDWIDLEIAPGAGFGAAFGADLFGVQGNAGLRFAFGGLYAEPSVGLAWVDGEVDPFATGGATVAAREADSLLGRAGLRLGGRVPLGGGALLPFVSFEWREELGGREESAFSFGETLRLIDDAVPTRGEAAAGFSFVAGPFEGFVRGEVDLGGGNAKAARAGARLVF